MSLMVLESLVEWSELFPTSCLTAIAVSQFFLIRFLVKATRAVLKSPGAHEYEGSSALVHRGGEQGSENGADGADHAQGDRAEAAWARADGRYKHCALRPDIFGEAPPPRYAQDNNDALPLPEMSPKEAAGLAELVARLSDLTPRGVRTDRSTLLPFLRARKGSVKNAEAYYRKAVEYRYDRLRMHELDTHWNLEAYERILAPWWTRGGILGHGLKGQVVGFERFGRCRFAELLDAIPWEILLRLDAVHMQRTLAAFEEDSLRRGRPTVATLVLDLEGLGVECLNFKTARAYGKLISYRDMIMPNMLSHILVIRSPKAFAQTFKLFSYILDPVTRDKVQIVSGHEESLACLRRHIGNDMIPAYLGGERCINGDPNCAMILGTADPGPVPEKALRRLRDSIARGEQEQRAARGARLAEDGAVPAGREREAGFGVGDCLGCCMGPRLRGVVG
mmetsp:Transcript_27759/g.89278  ORF Transcript_27759/g.89278 Transcript_27759/m.89278 type:complete len:450 (+) Transcript_27759:81-1430(+)